MQNKTHFFLLPDCMLEQSTTVQSVYCSKGHDDYDFCTMMKSRTNVVSMSAGLNEATCVIKVPVCLRCKVQISRCWDGGEKKKNRNQVCIFQDLSGDIVQTSPLEKKPQEPLG